MVHTMHAPRVEYTALLMRSGEQVTGRFARHIGLRRLALVWIQLDQKLSEVACSWTRAETFGAVLPDASRRSPASELGMAQWREERRAAWLRWIDERGRPDRRPAAWPTHFSPQGADRYTFTGCDRRVLARAAGASRSPSWRPILTIVRAMALVFAATGWWLPDHPLSVAALISPASGSSP